MKTTTVKRFFPNSEATIVHQDGLSMPGKGAEIMLHTRGDERDPWCAEVTSGDHYAEISLSFDGR